ncbi:MAG: Rrf2 family transcriptional regulator [Clostridiales bacterium]|nr:Rrf2 family transcriptional regulator [Clostridiales bacterium]
MMISTRGRYALRVMVDLAERDTEEYVALREIAESQDISEKYLEAIVKRLVREGLIRGTRGKGGGYKLSKKPNQYTVGSILKAADESLAPVACLETEKNSCERADICKVLPMWEKLNVMIDIFFEGITLDMLV